MQSVRPYFAYGSNMSPDQMHERCRGSSALQVARLGDHRFMINERGVATVVPSPGSAVFGVLWTVSPGHVDQLDHFEGVAKGHYVRETAQVMVDNNAEDDRVIDAWIYFACHSIGGSPREGYLERVIRGAVHFGLDRTYVDGSLRPWASGVLEES